MRHEIASGKETVIARSDDADLSDAVIQPTSHVVQAAAFDPGRKHWTVVDPSIQADFDAIAKISDGDFSVVDRDLADKTWLVSFDSDRAPTRYYSWDRASRKATLLFSVQPKLDDAPLAPMKPVEFTARDGMKLNGYLTLPVGVPAKNLPMVLAVHGGPWARDNWGFAPYTQLLANRGYAVLQVNFRGSTGFGKKYLHAGDREWGLTMQSDLTDGVKWAVAQNIADPARVAIFGGSYGGYAALAGAAFTPDVYRCAVDECGPSNLFTLLASIPPYWAVMRSIFDTRVGNPERSQRQGTAEDRVAAVLCRQDKNPDADRTGRKRSASKAGRGRADCRRYREASRERGVRLVSRRRARFRPAREPARFHRAHGKIPRR